MNLSFRHYYWRWMKNLLLLSIIFIIFMTVARISFAFYFGDSAMLKHHSHELKRALWLGLRFDLMPLAYINAVPFLLMNFAYFIPGKITIKITRFLIVSIFCISYFLICWLYLFDYGFYSYFQEHLNVLVFGFFEDDTWALIKTIFKNYNAPFGLTILSLIHYGIYRFVKFLFSPFDFDVKKKPLTWKVPAIFFSGLVLIVFFARGNFGRLPLSVEDSHISNNEFINEISLNGALTLNRAFKIRKTFGKDQYDYLKNYGFNGWQEAFRAFTGYSSQSSELREALTATSRLNPYAKSHPPHVVMVVMESFGTYWNDYEAEDFQVLGDLKNHFHEGFLFKNFLPSENGTIGSIVSVATSQVIRPGARFLSESEFMKTHLASSGHLAFKESGYETHFVYGGKLGWRDLGKFLQVQKYDKLWGADEIKEAMPELSNISETDLGNEWGIFDEYLYTFIEEQIRTSSKPQFFLVLTTSNHPPFEYPSSYQPKKILLKPEIRNKLTVSEDLALKRFTGLQYANQKMSEFLTKVKKSSFSDQTIVGFTGDHSFWIAKGVGQDLEFKRYAVPFYLSIPPKYSPGEVDTTKFGSHEDIFPTLINLALSEKKYVKLGEDLVTEKTDAMNNSGLIANEYGAFHHGAFWKWIDLEKQILVPAEATPELLELKSKANGIIGLTDAFLKAEKNRRPSDVKDGQQ